MIPVLVTIGELLDRLTILELKINHLVPGWNRLLSIDFAVLTKAVDEVLDESPGEVQARLVAVRIELFAVNSQLWNIKEKLREKEKAQEFDGSFTELARQVYLVNDRRSLLVREADELTENLN